MNKHKHNRCIYDKVWTYDTLSYKCCKKKQYYFNYCKIHYLMFCEKYIIKIQSVYKGRIVRKKLKNIFYN